MATRLYTSEELLRMPEDECGYELEGGELVRLSPTGFTHGRLVMKLGHEIMAWIERNNLPFELAADVFVRFAPPPLETVKGPDLVLVSTEALGGRMPVGVLDPTPVFLVEVISPDDDLAYLAHKVRLYLDSGVTEVWVVDPPAHVVKVHRLHDAQTTPVEGSFPIGTTLSSPRVLPGWSLAVDDLFAGL